MNSMIVPEVYFFLSAVFFGALLSACYDQLRVFRMLLKHPAYLVDAEDILFFLSAGLGFFGLLYIRNEGSMRWFAFFGCALGACLYLKTLGPVVRFLETRALNILLFPLGKILEILKKWLQKREEQITIKKEQKRRNQQGSSGDKVHEPKSKKAKKKKRT